MGMAPLVATPVGVALTFSFTNCYYIYIYTFQGDLEEGLKKFQDLVYENPRDFRPYLCQVMKILAYLLLLFRVSKLAFFEVSPWNFPTS